MGHTGLLRAAAAACCVAAAAAGCAAVPTSTLDRASVEGRISVWLADHYHLPRPAVTCPPAVSGRPGARFSCATTLAGTPVTVSGTVASADGQFRIALDRAVIDRGQVSRVLADGLGARGSARPSVDCGPGPVVVAPGGTFTCTADYGTVTTVVTGTASDLEGDVSFSVGQVAHAGPIGGNGGAHSE